MLLIQGGLIKTITGGDIPDGQILIDDGKILAVGKKVEAPENCETWSMCTVRLMLQNERYCGDILLQKTICESHIYKIRVEKPEELDPLLLLAQVEMIGS